MLTVTIGCSNRYSSKSGFSTSLRCDSPMSRMWRAVLVAATLTSKTPLRKNWSQPSQSPSNRIAVNRS